MSTIVRDCPYCNTSARLTMPPPDWDGPKAVPDEGEVPHTCRAHAKPAAARAA